MPEHEILRLRRLKAQRIADMDKPAFIQRKGPGWVRLRQASQYEHLYLAMPGFMDEVKFDPTVRVRFPDMYVSTLCLVKRDESVPWGWYIEVDVHGYPARVWLKDVEVDTTGPGDFPMWERCR